jgi:phosphoribosylformylglycinamidine cyclo-ligase
VDITSGYRAIELIKPHAARARTPGVIHDLGGFGGLFEPDFSGIASPVLVSGADGVGTKLKIAFALNKHDTVGIDCVAMCVNDIICCGAKPLYFLDYIACGRIKPGRVEAIVRGVAGGCIRAGCALIGGETAEMPGFYDDDEYDLAGFATGVADKAKLFDVSTVKAGDAIIGLPSSGIHSNGFSLIRAVFSAEALGTYSNELGAKLGETLLTPTKIYAKPLLALSEQVNIKSAAHITGGGLFENIPRAIPGGLSARVARSALDTPPIFDLIRRAGDVPERDMYNTFNMGAGMALVVSGAYADRAVNILKSLGEDARIIGEVIAGGGGMELC